MRLIEFEFEGVLLGEVLRGQQKARCDVSVRIGGAELQVEIGLDRAERGLTRKGLVESKKFCAKATEADGIENEA